MQIHTRHNISIKYKQRFVALKFGFVNQNNLMNLIQLKLFSLYIALCLELTDVLG